MPCQKLRLIWQAGMVGSMGRAGYHCLWSPVITNLAPGPPAPSPLHLGPELQQSPFSSLQASINDFHHLYCSSPSCENFTWPC